MPHIEARGIALYTSALTVIGCRLCPGRGLTLDKWALFSWWQCSEGDAGRAVSESQQQGGIVYFGPEGRDLVTHRSIPKAAGFNCFTLPCVSHISMKLRLLVLSSATSAPRTSTAPMEFKSLLFN